MTAIEFALYGIGFAGYCYGFSVIAETFSRLTKI